MLKSILRLSLIGTVTGALFGIAAQAQVQNTNKAPAPAGSEKKEVAKKPISGPFHGRLANLDKAAKTITVGKRTFHITPETKILRNDKPATLEDAVVGEEVSGYMKPDEAGKMFATKLNLGPKAGAQASAKKSAEDEKGKK
jgi:hypothetical protein